MPSNRSHVTVAGGQGVQEERSPGSNLAHKHSLNCIFLVEMRYWPGLSRRAFLMLLHQMEKKQCLIWEGQILKYPSNSSLLFWLI